MSSSGRDRPAPPPEPLGVPAVDSHTHLDDLGADVEQVLASAAAVGVTRVVDVGFDLASSRAAADRAARLPSVLAAVAIHPNDAGDADDATLSAIDALAGRPRVRAVGETGLDHYWWRQGSGVEPSVQEASFRAHIAIAKERGVALMIHDRDAHDDLLRVLLDEGAPPTTVFHCFSGDAAMARTCAARGYLMSFAGTVTFKNAGPLREALAVVPDELLLVETDAPYLTPVPHRGWRNAPDQVPRTLRAMAQLRGVDADRLAAVTAANAVRAFGSWDDPGPEPTVRQHGHPDGGS